MVFISKVASISLLGVQTVIKGPGDGLTTQIGWISMEWVQEAVAIMIDCQWTRYPPGDRQLLLVFLALRGEIACYFLFCEFYFAFAIICACRIRMSREIGPYGSRSRMFLWQICKFVRGLQ
jgi:hypothetical protein